MLWDDGIDGVRKPKVVSERAYSWLGAGVFVGLLTVDLLVLRIAWWWRHPLPAWVFSTMTGLNIPLARLLTHALLKRRGLLRGGTTVTVWIRATAILDESIGTEVVEVRSERDDEIIISVFSFMVFVPLTVLTAKLAVGLFSADGRWTSIGLFALSLIAMIASGWVGVSLVRGGDANGPPYRANGAGLAGPRGEPLIPWVTVASYRVTTRCDPLGQPLSSTHELIGRDGKTILPLLLDNLAPGDKDRLLQFIAARFPKPVKLDFTE